MRTIAPLDFASATMTDYQKAYRAIMTAEEALVMAGNHCLDDSDEYTPSADYVFGLQEMLSGERWDLISSLKQRPMADPYDESLRIALLVEYEAWCGEFTKETLDLLAASTLTTKAV